MTEQELRSRILFAALETFGKEGFFEAKMLTIARLAKISKSTLYAMFPSKEELYTDMMKFTFSMYLTTIERHIQKQRTFPETLQAISQEHLQNIWKQRHRSGMYLQLNHKHEEAMDALMDFIEAYIELIRQFFEQHGIENAATKARLYVGMLDSFRNEIFMDPSFNEERLTEIRQQIDQIVITGF